MKKSKKIHAGLIKTTILTVCSGAVLFWGLPVSAQKEESTLKLNDFLKQVEAYYPKIAGAEAERRSASAKRLSTQGAFDTNIRGGTNFEQYNSNGRRRNFTISSVGVEIVTRDGIGFFGGMTLNTGSVKSPASDSGGLGTYLLGVRLPLLRGFRQNPRAAAEQQAILAEGLADAMFADSRIEILYGAGTQYWHWTGAGRRVNIAKELLAVAKVREAQIKQEVESGARQGIDAYEAETEVLRRQESLVKTERDLQKETFKLGLYLWTDQGERQSYPGVERMEKVTPPPALFTDNEVEDGKKSAFANRPELKAIAQSLAMARVDQKLAKNDMLPSVDLLVNPGVDVGFSSIGPQIKYGITVAVPLERRSARGKVEEAKLKIVKLTQEQKLMRQQIETEIDDALSAMKTAYDRYYVAVAELQAAKRLEQGERDRLALGEGTLFLINQRERATAEAANKVVGIQAEFEQAKMLFFAITMKL